MIFHVKNHGFRWRNSHFCVPHLFHRTAFRVPGSACVARSPLRCSHQLRSSRSEAISSCVEARSPASKPRRRWDSHGIPMGFPDPQGIFDGEITPNPGHFSRRYLVTWWRAMKKSLFWNMSLKILGNGYIEIYWNISVWMWLTCNLANCGNHGENQ